MHWSYEEFTDLVSKLKIFIISHMIIIAEVAGSSVGMLMFVPDCNYVLKKLNGRLFPFRILKFLYYRKKIDNLSKIDDYGRYKRV